MNKLMLFSGTSNQPLAKEISANLGIALSPLEIKKFSDQEISVEIGVKVRGADVFIIQPTSCSLVDNLASSVNDNLMELLIMIDALRRASARRITAVITYYGYARQDRKDRPRVPITAKLVANLLTAAGAQRVLFLDLHSPPITGFYEIPVDHLYASPVIIKYLQDNVSDIIMVSPDAGGATRARAYAERLDVDYAIVDKRRKRVNVSEAMNVIGNVKGKRAVLIDDIVDTFGTMQGAADILMKHGAIEVLAAGTHGVLSGPAIERLQNSRVTTLLLTNSISLDEKLAQCDKIKILSVAPLFANAIKRIHEEDSLSVLFK